MDHVCVPYEWARTSSIRILRIVYLITRRYQRVIKQVNAAFNEHGSIHELKVQNAKNNCGVEGPLELESIDTTIELMKLRDSIRAEEMKEKNRR